MAATVTIGSTFNPNGIKKAQRELAKLEAVAKKSGDTTAAAWYAASGKIAAVQGVAASTGAAMTKHITMPLALVAGASVNAAIQFETAFTGVEKTVDGTAEQMAELEQGIRDMAKSIPASTTEISAVAEAAGQLGIQTENVLEFTRTMVDMGESTVMSSEDAATSLAQLANIVQMPQDKFDELGSAIVDLGNNMATNEQQIVDMGLRIAAAGDQVGMTVDQTMALAATLASVGIEAEAGGSAISKTMINIESAVQSGGEQLELWAETAGMSAEEFSEAWQSEPAKALNSVITGLGDMEAQGGSTLKQLEKLGITEVRQRDALMRAAGAGDLFTKALNISSDAWKKNTALANEAQKRYETNASKLEILRNKVNDTGIELGGTLAPAMVEVIDAAEPILRWAGDVAESFSELDEQQQQQIIKWVAIAAAAGPATSLISKAATPVVALTKGVGGLHMAFKTGAEQGPKWAKVIANGAIELGKMAKEAKNASSATELMNTRLATTAIRGLRVYAAYKLATESYEKLAPAAKEAGDAAVESGEHTITAAEAVNSPISSLAYSWTLARDAAAKYNDTGEETVTTMDLIANPISAVMYGVARLTGETNKNKDATDALVDSMRSYSDVLSEVEGLNRSAERADIDLERAKMRVAEAQEDVNRALDEYGKDSPEHREAVLSLRDAELNLEDAELRAAEAARSVNEAVSNMPRPNTSNAEDWVRYYEAIGDAAGAAAAKANLLNKDIVGGKGKSSTGGKNIPVYGGGTLATDPHLAVVGDKPEIIVPLGDEQAAAQYLPILYDSLDMSGGSQYPARLSASGGNRYVTIAAGAIQIILPPGTPDETARAAGQGVLAALERELMYA